MKRKTFNVVEKKNSEVLWIVSSLGEKKSKKEK